MVYRLAAAATFVALAVALTACAGGSAHTAFNSPIMPDASQPTPDPAPTADPAPPSTPPPMTGPPDPPPPNETPAPPPPDVASTGVPASAAVFSQIHAKSGWTACTGCAGGSGNAAFSMQQNVAAPSLTGKSTKFSLGGSRPYSNVLWWKELPATSSVHNFVYDMFFYIVDPTAPQALEFDVQHSIGPLRFIFGTECDFHVGHMWRLWDTLNGRWVSSSVPCPHFAAKQWNHLILRFQRTASNRVLFVSVTVNGKTSPINKSFSPKKSSGQEIAIAFQQDGNASQTDYSVWVDKLTLSYW